jgi:hypothetical protein
LKLKSFKMRFNAGKRFPACCTGDLPRVRNPADDGTGTPAPVFKFKYAGKAECSMILVTNKLIADVGAIPADCAGTKVEYFCKKVGAPGQTSTITLPALGGDHPLRDKCTDGFDIFAFESDPAQEIESMDVDYKHVIECVCLNTGRTTESDIHIKIGLAANVLTFAGDAVAGGDPDCPAAGGGVKTATKKWKKGSDCKQ